MKRQILKNIYYLIPAVIFGLIISSGICTAAVIKVEAESTVVQDKIYLKDIIAGDVSDDILQKIGDIKIGNSPRPGKKKKIPAGLIKSRVRSVFKEADIDIQLPSEIITVKRASQHIPDKVFKSLYTDYVGKKLTGKKFSISKINIKGNKKLPAGKLSLKVEENPEKDISGHYRLIVNALPEKGNKRRILISGWIDRYDHVVYAKNEITKGDTIYSEDLYTDLTNTTKYPSDIYHSTEAMIGQVAKTGIRKDSPIRQKMIGATPAVKKGDIVKMTARSGLLTVVTIGQAVENGRVGEQVKIRNLKSKKIVTGYVLDSKMVEVVF